MAAALRKVELSVAPMMEVTNRHYRYLARLLSKRTVLYTEMVVSSTILNNLTNLEPFLGFDPVEKPIALQLGGNDPEALGRCAAIGEQAGYDEINLNCGCPSSRVAGNEFGASLMLKPELVRSIYVSMRQNVAIPVTIKCRLGCDNQEEYDHVKRFVESIPECDHFIIHARNCILNGLKLTPTQNRSIPPLKHDYVFQLVKDFPTKKFTINGEIKTIQQATQLFNEHSGLFGVMIGRAAWHDISILTEVDPLLYQEAENPTTRRKVIKAYMDYCQRNKDQFRMSMLMKPIAGLVTGCKNSKKFRGAITQSSVKTHLRDYDYQAVAERAMTLVPQPFLDAPLGVFPKQLHETMQHNSPSSGIDLDVNP